ncbi:hypothetical protein [Microbacterium luticocti]|uniref:hypothetical protein n=1 Tax=Microbacterium luticocti TaxID=451764 RepID=UPI0004106271|nr:hypothetical protein [Microbacterium luticocti]
MEQQATDASAQATQGPHPQGATDATAAPAGTVPAAGTAPMPEPAPVGPATAAAGPGIPPRRRHLARDLTLIVVVVVALLAGMAAGGVAVYRALYGPSAFVQHYLSLLASGHAADALKVPGVAVDRSVLQAAGLPKNASEALLRQASLAQLTDIRIDGEKVTGEVTEVTASYRAGGYAGSTTFAIERNGQIGVIPTWRFARSPLAVIDLTVHGSMSFQVNGFHLDKRQVALAGAEVDPADPVPLLVFSPGLYAVRVDTAISYAAGVAVLSDAPLKNVPVQLQTQPTSKFVDVVQDRVNEFLTQCATQQVLQPTGCPFGYVVDNRIIPPPRWSLPQPPKITVVPKGEGWAVPPTEGVAHIVVDVVSIYDGSIRHVDQDVPFTMVATIDISPSGTASIRVSSPDGG